MKMQGKIIRRMGFIRDQEGIMNRYLREKSGWETHLQHTREFIQDSFRNPGIKSVAVLGSGWLLDVPLEYLRLHFDHVYLVDIHHPVQIRKKTAPMDNVELIEADLSGGAVGQLWQLSKNRSKQAGGGLMDQISLQHPLQHINYDALISVNLLNQLDIMLCDFISRRNYFQQEKQEPLRSALQKFHLQWITATPGCLISDVTEKSEDKKGNLSSKSLLHTDLPEGIRRESWTWEFDSQGTYRPNILTTMEVKAVEWA
ncbi:MAG: hypothetical protein ABFS28_13690 [Bacteroidota bacterium]